MIININKIAVHKKTEKIIYIELFDTTEQIYIVEGDHPVYYNRDDLIIDHKNLYGSLFKKAEKDFIDRKRKEVL